MNKGKQYYVKETNVYAIMARNKKEAIDKVQNNEGRHQYSRYNITY